MIATVRYLFYRYGRQGGLCGVGVPPRSDPSSRPNTITQDACLPKLCCWFTIDILILLECLLLAGQTKMWWL